MDVGYTSTESQTRFFQPKLMRKLMTNKTTCLSDSEIQTRAVRKRMIQVIVQFVIYVAILFFCAGRVDWLWAWVYIGAAVVNLIINYLLMPRELIAERGRQREGVKDWDKTITSLTIIPALIAPVIAGLDERFGWSPDLGLVIHLVGLALLILGQGLFTWSMVSNPFFSTGVRIQMDRDHRVATSGPYKFVRHPGYTGFITFTIGTSLLLGSLWALIPAGITAVLLIIRTVLEDKTLREELPGYQDYANRVGWRLLPGFW